MANLRQFNFSSKRCSNNDHKSITCKSSDANVHYQQTKCCDKFKNMIAGHLGKASVCKNSSINSKTFLRHKNSLIICLLIIIISEMIPINTVLASHNTIYMENGAYRDILVTFDKSLPKDQSRSLLDNLQETFQSVSDKLYEASNHTVCISEVVAVVPNEWIPFSLGRRKYNATRSFTALDADIYIHNSGNMFNNNPYTEQYGQCGQPGKLIHLSKDLFLNNSDTNNNSSKFHTGNLILHEWAHYRYGLFDEHGYRNDKYHPISIQDSESTAQLITSCAADEYGSLLQLKLTSYGSLNDCKSDHLTDTQPSRTTCHLSPDRDRITSSIMFNPHLSSVSKFCSEQSHNAFSPTKQNRLCDGKSAHQVLRTHPDFKRLTNTRARCITNLAVAGEKSPRIAVFLDLIHKDSHLIVMPPIWKLLRRYKPLIYQLSKDDAQQISDDSLNPSARSPNDPVNLYYGIEKIRNEVRNVGTGDITNLFIITAGLFLAESELENYAKELRSYDIKVKIILYPYIASRDDDYAPLMRFAQAMNAELTVIPSSEPDKSPSVIERIRMMESIGLERSTVNPDDVVILAKSTAQNQRVHTLDFELDSSLVVDYKYTIKVIMLCNLTESCRENNITLRRDNRAKVYMEGTFNPYDSRMIMFPLDSKSLGRWSVEFSDLNEHKQYGFVAYAERIMPSHSSKSEHNNLMNIPSLNRSYLSGSCWLNHQGPIVSLKSRNDRLYAYVSLKRDTFEYVQNATVLLRIHDDTHGQVYSYPMFDDGLGDPDITEGDSIWSVMIYGVPTQMFLRAEAHVLSNHMELYEGLNDKPCCGQSVPEPAVRQGIDWVTRVLDCGTIKIDLPGVERLARPGRAFDLRAALVDGRERATIKVELTTPQGIKSVSDVKIFNTSERYLMRSSFDLNGKRLGDGNYPVEYGFKFDKEFVIPGRIEITGPYYVVVQLKDENDVKYLSNIATVYLTADPPLIPPSSEAPYSRGLGGSGLRRAGGYPILGVWQMTAIIVGSFLFILIILLFIICLVAGRRRHGNKDDESDSKKKLPSSLVGNDNPDKSVYRSYDDNMMGIKVNSGDSDDNRSVSSHHPTLTHTNNIPTNQLSQQQQHHHHQHQHHHHHLSHNNIINDTIHPAKNISPIDSIPVDKLLEHYDKVKCAKQRNEPPPVMRIEDFTETGSINNASSTLSDNSRFRGSMTGVDDHAFMNPISEINHWRYQTSDPYTSPYSHYNYPNPNVVNSNYVHTPSNILDWHNAYEGLETTSDYDPRYGTVEKRITAVSQV